MTRLHWQNQSIMEPDWYSADTEIGVLEVYPSWAEDEWFLLKTGWQNADGTCKDGYELHRGPSVADCIAKAEELRHGG